MDAKCGSHDDIVSGLSDVGARLSAIETTVKETRSVLFEIRDWMIAQKAITTTIPKQQLDEAEISVTDKVVKVDLKKIDWIAVGKAIGYLGPLILAAMMWISGSRQEAHQHDAVSQHGHIATTEKPIGK